MKFEKMRPVLKNVVDVFQHLCNGDTGLDLPRLEESMSLLHGDMSRNEVMELFNFVDIDDSKKISLKEFLVALTIGYVLQAIPALAINNDDDVSSDRFTSLHGPPATGQDKIQTTTKQDDILAKRTVSALLGKGADVRRMLNLIVSAYLLFDPIPEGFIRKDSVERLLEEDGHKLGSNSVLSETRWNEMVS